MKNLKELSTSDLLAAHAAAVRAVAELEIQSVQVACLLGHSYDVTGQVKHYSGIAAQLKQEVESRIQK